MKTINAHELKSMIDRDEDVTVIDTLPEASYKKQHIPGAYSIPLKGSNFASSVGDIVDTKEDTVVVYCANTDCDLSPTAARKLEENGFENVIDFEGGIEEWKQAGYEVASGSAVSPA